MGYETILYEEDGPIGTLTLKRFYDGEESPELGAAFAERRKPDPERFRH